MRHSKHIHRAVLLGATALLLALGCGGGSGTVGDVDAPFSSNPSSNDGVPSSSPNNPVSGQQPSSGLGSSSTPPSNQGPQTAPPSSGGGFEAPGGGSGACVGSLLSVYDRCGLTAQLQSNAQAQALVDQILGQICSAIQAAPACYACFQANISQVPCTNFDDDDTNDDKSFENLCNDACKGVDFEIEIGGSGGSGGSSGAGGAGGGNNGSNFCDKCGDISSGCPQFASSCAALCGSSSKACSDCIKKSPTDCESLSQCASVCDGGSAGSAGAAGSGSNSCLQVLSCCAQLSGDAQAACAQVYQSNNDAACQAFLSQCPAN